MKIRDLLKIKDLKYRIPVTVGPDEAISMAIQKMAEHDRGSLPVCNDIGELVGIISERDIVRKYLDYGDAYPNIKVQDIMTRQVVIGIPEDDRINGNVLVEASHAVGGNEPGGAPTFSRGELKVEGAWASLLIVGDRGVVIEV